jgi:GNAT superfamily N-acetyltransferase
VSAAAPTDAVVREEFLLPRVRVTLRSAAPADADRMQWSGGDASRARHAERIARQELGEAVYVIASIQDCPVAHAFLKWGGKPSAPDYPDIEDIRVLEPLRGCGIGSALLHTCEQVCRQRGFDRVGMAVNPVRHARAWALYERLGYRTAGTAPYVRGVLTSVDDDGDAHYEDDIVMDLVKALDQ